jgi:hypothetical protein
LKRILIVAVAAFFLTIFLGAASAARKPAYPPDGIYTCSWIAANPTAATLAGVSCSPDMVNRGSSISPQQAAQLEPNSAESIGMARVPSSGAIGQNVWAATSYEYTTAWSWNAGSQHETYTWYIKKTDDTTQKWGYGFDGGETTVPANIYRWKVQNTGQHAQYWIVLYSDY